MADSAHADGILSSASDYDAVVVGASLAGCAAATMLGRSGARVALVEQRPDPAAFKRVCTHFIQSSAVATIERLGLLEPMMAAGALRSRPRIWTRWGWIEPPRQSSVPSGINLRRELLDPMIRALAAETPGVELMLGRTVNGLLREGDRVCGVRAQSAAGEETRLRASLVIGADGRGSRVAELAGVRSKRSFHGRFAYGGYFEGPPPQGAPNGSLWLLDPHMAAAFPTDDDLTFYAVMPTRKRLPEFRSDPAAALVAFVADVPDAPPILESRMVGSVVGRLDMTNVANSPIAPGLALVGDAATAIDPLWGVGCGWALQSAEWLADSVGQALGEAERSRDHALEVGLRCYRRRYSLALSGHMAMIRAYATGRRLNAPERMLFSAATRSERLAEGLEAFASRNVGPARTMARALPTAVAVNARHALTRKPGDGSARRTMRSAQAVLERSELGR